MSGRKAITLGNTTREKILQRMSALIRAEEERLPIWDGHISELRDRVLAWCDLIPVLRLEPIEPTITVASRRPRGATTGSVEGIHVTPRILATGNGLSFPVGEEELDRSNPEMMEGLPFIMAMAGGTTPSGPAQLMGDLFTLMMEGYRTPMEDALARLEKTLTAERARASEHVSAYVGSGKARRRAKLSIRDALAQHCVGVPHALDAELVMAAMASGGDEEKMSRQDRSRISKAGREAQEALAKIGKVHSCRLPLVTKEDIEDVVNKLIISSVMET